MIGRIFSKRQSALFFYSLTFFVIAADQLTKIYVRSVLDLGRSVEVIPDFFSLTLVFNRGAAWGIFAGFRIGFVVLAVAMVVFILIWRKSIFGDGRLGYSTAVLLVGGIVGNAIDRVLYGEVTDFIHLWHGSYHFPCFNIADSAICVGVFLYIILSLMDVKRKK